MAAVTLSNAITTTVTDQNGLAPPSASPAHQTNTYLRLHGPQISVEQADDKMAGLGDDAPISASTPKKSAAHVPSSLDHKGEGLGEGQDTSHLRVSSQLTVRSKSASLPLSASLDRHTPSVDSSAYSSDASDDPDRNQGALVNQGVLVNQWC